MPSYFSLNISSESLHWEFEINWELQEKLTQAKPSKVTIRIYTVEYVRSCLPLILEYFSYTKRVAATKKGSAAE